MTALYPLKVEKDYRKAWRYLGSLFCIANIGLSVYTQKLLPKDHNNDAELATINVNLLIVYLLRVEICYKNK